MSNVMTRRGFVAGAACSAAAVAAIGSAAIASADEAAAEGSSGSAFERGVDWDAEYDVVVLGYGFAGAVSAITAAEEGARVLIVEKMDPKKCGGNSRYAMQVMLGFDETRADEALSYLQSIRGMYDTPDDDTLQTYVDGCIETPKWIEEHGGWVSDALTEVGEFKNLVGWDLMDYRGLYGTCWNGALYNFLQDLVNGFDNIDIWYEAPAKHLIQDPVTKIVHGVEVESGGEAYRVRAMDGVVMCTGGFEANLQMVQDYLQMPYAYPKGGLYNTGDGIHMATEVGAQLWHMSNTSGPDLNYIDPETGRVGGFVFAGFSSVIGHDNCFCTDNSAIIVGADGTRFNDEGTLPGHGFIHFHGTLIHTPLSLPAYCVFDSKAFERVIYPVWDNEEQVEKGAIVKADPLDELAAALGLPEGSLSAEVEKYNGYCAAGLDPEFARKTEFLVPLEEEGPYYAFEVKPSFTNTQGGPRRAVDGHVVDTQGNPIPHLYSSGELGSIWADVYQGASNIGECLIFGRISGRNAAASKDDNLRASCLSGEGVDLTRDTSLPVVECGENEYTAVQYGVGGAIVVKVTYDGETISAVEIVDNNETEGIGSVAIEKMPARIVEANSADVDVVAGASTTSRCIIGAVAEAIAQA